MPRFSGSFWFGFISGVGFAALTGSAVLACAAFATVYISLGGWRFLRALYRTGPRDFRVLLILSTVISRVKRLISERKGVHDVFEETVKKLPNKVAIIFEGKEWTFQELDHLANRIANYLSKSGFHPGETIAIFMENCPEYVALYIGMSKIGVVASLINCNLRSQSLVHCLREANSIGMIFGISLSEAVAEVQDSLNGIKLFCLDGKPEGLPAVYLEPALRACSIDKPDIELKFSLKDILFYIYTSGTTGLPKAGRFPHMRYVYLSIAMAVCHRLTAEDIIYVSLPLYHTNACVLGVGIMVQEGATVVLRRKFSASHFWEECCQYKCTAVQYIGEVCRYLLAQPPRPTDTQHCVKVAYGNGLQKELWERFQSRFQVPMIREYYGSTEGNISVINMTGKVGSCGFISVIDPFDLFPIILIKLDEVTEQPIRDSNGFCIVCQPGESGEIIGLVQRNMFRRFDGYTNNEQTQKKLIHDVRQKGDDWFRSGDVFTYDEDGYLYFIDRIGDTYRWKGENVSTREVETVMSNLLEMRDVAVFGVPVPKTEGKAGMAVIAADQAPDIDLIKLKSQLSTVLPHYTHPMFIRIVRSCNLTGTFKLKKGDLKAEGYNVHSVTDPLFYFESQSTKQYKVLDREAYEAILNGTIQF
jgi:solute carrier family 27 fatty acid transporter 1/4